MDPVLTDLFVNVTGGLITYVVEKLDSAESLKAWLKHDPASLAFQKALARAYSAFARQYPEYTSSLFDQSFLSTDALPEISKLLTRDQHPDPALLAQAWGQSIGADVDFAQAATKPASYFLERLEAELKAEPALQILFDSRALESLPKLQAEIQKLASDLKRGLDEALKTANNYQQATIHIGGSVSGEGIIIGHNNQLTINKYYYSGDFVSLNEYYIPPDGVFQRVQVDEFVGRDWLTAKVDAFLNDPNRKSGAFLLVGDAGVGKTAFMAHLVKERRYLHLFAEQVPGQAMLQRALQSLGSQLVTRYQIDPYKDRDTLNVLAGFPDFLERLLRLAASTLTEGEKIVIVCDALDEAGVFPDHFVFGLPKELPDGVYFILSQRPVNTNLPNFEPLRFDLKAQGDENLQDMETYLSAVAKRPAVAGQIRAKDYSEDFFTQTLKEKSLGVWMYLHYVIKEIERGQRAPLDLESLPKGLVGYYADYWDNWRSGRKGSDATKWDNLYVPLLATLAAAQEAITVEKLIEWAGVQASPSEVTRLLCESWSSFITEKEEKSNTVYTLYHQSLRDFITGKVEDIKKLPPTHASLVNDLSKKKVEAHQRIVNAFEAECNGEWEKLVEQDYPCLHLTAHLNGAKEYKKLTDLLTEGDEHIKWAEAREKKEETYAGYLNDLTHVWNYAELEQNYALAIRCMLIENSIHSLASNISPELLAELAKAGLWSYSRCLSTIRQKTDSGDQAKALQLLVLDIPIPHLLHQEALSIACEIKDEFARACTLSDLVPRLNDELKPQVLVAAREIRDERHRVLIFYALAPYITTELRAQMLQDMLAATRDIKNEDCRASALSAFSPNMTDKIKAQALKRQEMQIAIRRIRSDRALSNLLPNTTSELKSQALQDALATVCKIKDEADCASAFPALAPYLSDKLKRHAISSTRKIKGEYNHTIVLSAFLPYLDDRLKSQILQDMLAFACKTKNNEPAHARIIADLAPHLTNDLKPQAVAAACKIKDEVHRARALSDLMPYLAENLKGHALQEALNAAQGIKGDFTRALALSALAPYLTGELKIQTLQDGLDIVARKIKDEFLNVFFLSAFRPNLTDEYYNAFVFSTIAPHLNNELIPKALLSVRKIEDKFARLYALSALVPHLSNEIETQVHQEAWITLQDALIAARNLKSEPSRAFALSALVPFINSELKAQVLQEALSAAREIKDEVDRARVLSDLVPYLNDELKTQVLQETLSAVCEIKDEADRARALSDLATYLNDEFKPNALSAIYEIKDEDSRVRALTTLLPHLDKGEQIAILQKAIFVLDCSSWDKNLNKKLIVWKEIMFEGLEKHLTSLIKFVAQKKRKDGIKIFEALTPALVHFRGPKIADELYRAITDVTRWWP